MIKVNVCLGRGKGLGQSGGELCKLGVLGVHVAGVSIVAADYPHFVIDI